MARKEANTEVLDDSFDVDTFVDDSTGQAETAVAPASRGAMVLGGIQGEAEIPVKLPYLSIVYGVSQTIENFDVGDLLLDKATLLGHKNEPVKFIVINMETYWKEWFTPEEREIAQAEGRYERQFNTREEVKQAGGTCPLPGGKWPNNQRPTFSSAARINLLVQKPAGLVSGAFGVTLGEHEYAPACWIVDKTTFANVAPVISGAAGMALRLRGLQSGVFCVTIGMIKKPRGTQPVPTVKLIGNLSDEELAQLRAYFG